MRERSWDPRRPKRRPKAARSRRTRQEPLRARSRSRCAPADPARASRSSTAGTRSRPRSPTRAAAIRKIIATENAAHRLTEEGLDAAGRRRRSCGRTRSRRSSRPTPCIRGCWSRPIPSPRSDIEDARGRRHRAGARPDHRSAQCRRDPAHRGGVRGRRRSSPRRAIRPRRPACWRSPPPARSISCRS